MQSDEKLQRKAAKRFSLANSHFLPLLMLARADNMQLYKKVIYLARSFALQIQSRAHLGSAWVYAEGVCAQISLQALPGA